MSIGPDELRRLEQHAQERWRKAEAAEAEAKEEQERIEKEKLTDAIEGSSDAEAYRKRRSTFI